MGIFQQTVKVALLGKALVGSKHSGAHSGNSVAHYHGRQLAACEHIVAYGYLLIDYLVEQPLVHTLIMPADNENILPL